MTNDKNSTDSQAAIDRVVANFINGLPARVKAISSAYDASDWFSLRALSHKLAGAAIFGFPELGEAAHAVEISVDKERYESLAVQVEQVKCLVAKISSGEIIANPLNLLR